jgi:hypothetical protein
MNPIKLVIDCDGINVVNENGKKLTRIDRDDYPDETSRKLLDALHVPYTIVDGEEEVANV